VLEPWICVFSDGDFRILKAAENLADLWQANPNQDKQIQTRRKMPLIAYIDPGSGGLLVQLLAGGIAGAVAYLRFHWRTWGKRSTVEDDSDSRKVRASDQESSDQRN
jgi:hypothetical protein